MKILLLILIIAAGCTMAIEEYSAATVVINNLEQEFFFDVEVPLTQAGFAQGLMFRTNLDDDKGMLFAFDDTSPRSFWMKNTLIPLDIIFIDDDFIIRKIHNAVPCEEEPCQVYTSDIPIMYVLELRGNLTIENNIKAGNAVKIE